MQASLYVAIELAYWRSLAALAAQLLCVALSLFILAFELHRVAMLGILFSRIRFWRSRCVCRCEGSPSSVVERSKRLCHVRRVVEVRLCGARVVKALDIEGREISVDSEVLEGSLLVFSSVEPLAIVLNSGADLAELHALCTAPRSVSEMVGCVVAFSTSLERISSYVMDVAALPSFRMTAVSGNLLVRFRDLLEPAHHPLLRWYLSVVASERVSMGLGVVFTRSIDIARAVMYRVRGSGYLCEALDSLSTFFTEIPLRIWMGLVMVVLESLEESSIPLVIVAAVVLGMPTPIHVLAVIAFAVFVSRAVLTSIVSAKSSLPASVSLLKMVVVTVISTALIIGITLVSLGITLNSFIKLIRTV